MTANDTPESRFRVSLMAPLSGQATPEPGVTSPQEPAPDAAAAVRPAVATLAAAEAPKTAEPRPRRKSGTRASRPRQTSVSPAAPVETGQLPGNPALRRTAARLLAEEGRSPSDMRVIRHNLIEYDVP